ncbi:MAG: lactonase family protein [bacterium]
MRILLITAALLAVRTLGGDMTRDVYFGTYTHAAKSEGIYHATLDLKTGALSTPELAAAVANPSFIDVHPTGKFLYAVTEGEAGMVSAFAIDPATRKLRLLNACPSGGSGPCHLAINREGTLLLVANYGSGSVAAIPIRANGTLSGPSSVIQHHGSSVNPARQNEPHAHSITFSPDGRLAFAADLGLDKIMIYTVNAATGTLAPHVPAFVSIKGGAGPRHFTFHPNGRFAYLINELNNTLTAYAYNAQSGALTEVQLISTLPEDFNGVSWAAEVRIHPNGNFLYASNRGHDSLASYRIDPATGILTRVGFQRSGIDNPRHFNLDPSGRFCVVANQDSDRVCTFRVNPETGALEPVGTPVTIGQPVCVRFMLYSN